MPVGQYYHINHSRLDHLTEVDWKVALAKCKEHIKWRLKQKTLSGVHAASNIGADPIDHYLGISYEKIISGEWLWKEVYSLADQMIRIINSYISKAVEKASTSKSESFIITYTDKEEEFYDVSEPPENITYKTICEVRLQAIESACYGDDQLEFIVEALKEGKKRTEIADLLDLAPRQFDKLKEKLIRRVSKSMTT